MGGRGMRCRQGQRASLSRTEAQTPLLAGSLRAGPPLLCASALDAPHLGGQRACESPLGLTPLPVSADPPAGRRRLREHPQLHPHGVWEGERKCHPPPPPPPRAGRAGSGSSTHQASHKIGRSPPCRDHGHALPRACWGEAGLCPPPRLAQVPCSPRSPPRTARVP